MILAAHTLGSLAAGSVLTDPGAIGDPTSLRPILTEINGVDVRESVQMSTLRLQDTLGQPMSCTFTLVNPSGIPAIGQRVRAYYHAQVLFAGTISRVQRTSVDLRTVWYAIECEDFSQILGRRMLRRNFTDVTVRSLLESILENELAGEAVTIGTIDSRASLPFVNADGARVSEVCRTVAGTTGQSFYVDFDAAIQMRSSTVESAPLLLNETNVLLDGTEFVTDRESYRNAQIVVVRGTPLATTDPVAESVVQVTNDNQIAARQAIEGGTGQYDDIVTITHPTSNLPGAVTLLGLAYARALRASAGVLRQTIRLRVRGYGFRAGQIATVNLPTFGVVGEYVVQRVSLTELTGTLLFHDLELSLSSAQQRAYEAWASIVREGKVTVQPPGVISGPTTVVSTPGSSSYVVPAGVTQVQLTCYGASAGGSGGARAMMTIGPYVSTQDATGGTGGNSGLAIATVDVVAGQTLTVTVGAAGVAGTSATQLDGGNPVVATGSVGTSGGLSQVSYGGTIFCQANGGLVGGAATASILDRGGALSLQKTGTAGLPGTGGSGIGAAVTVGGGLLGGAGGLGAGAPGSGLDGRVEIVTGTE